MSEIPKHLQHLPEAQALAAMKKLKQGYTYHSIDDDGRVIIKDMLAHPDDGWWAIDKEGREHDAQNPGRPSINSSTDGAARNMERFKDEWPAWWGAVKGTVADLFTFKGGPKKIFSNLIDVLGEPMKASYYISAHVVFFALVAAGVLALL